MQIIRVGPLFIRPRKRQRWKNYRPTLDRYNVRRTGGVAVYITGEETPWVVENSTAEQFVALLNSGLKA